jgi:hypothetical protein
VGPKIKGGTQEHCLNHMLQKSHNHIPFIKFLVNALNPKNLEKIILNFLIDKLNHKRNSTIFTHIPIGLFGFWSMIVFLLILTIGFIYEWKKGALDWE